MLYNVLDPVLLYVLGEADPPMPTAVSMASKFDLLFDNDNLLNFP